MATIEVDVSLSPALNIGLELQSSIQITPSLSPAIQINPEIVAAGPRGYPGLIQSLVGSGIIEIDDSDPNEPIIFADVDVADLPTGIPATNIADGSISNTEFQYLNNVSSNIQTQLDNKQALDAELSAIAGLTSAANKGIQFTGSGTAATYDLTTAGKALLDDANADAQLVTLGLTATATELNYTDGVTSAIQTQLDAKQPLDSDLSTIAGLTATTDNFMVATASAWASRTPTQARSQMGLGSLATLSAIDADSVTISNLEVDNLKTGVIDADLSSVSASDDTIPSAKATKTALDLKAPLASPTFTGTVTLPTGLTGVLRADSGVVSTDTDVTDLVSAASDTAAGKVELATTAETATGTDATRAVTPDGLHDMTTLAGAAWFLDEDDLVSDSATKTASQQSIKAYVSAAVAAGVSDGDKGDIVVSSSGSVWDIDSGVLTAAGRALIDDANAAAQLVTLGLSATAAELNYTDGVTSAIQTQLDTKAPLASPVFSGSVDLNGIELILDADADTSITADTDDQIDFRLSGADDFRMVADVFRALSGSVIETNTINETTAAAGVTIDGVLLKDNKIGQTYISNPYSFRAWGSGATTLTDNTPVKIALATEDYDYNGNFATSTYTVPVAGVYHFDGAVRHATAGAATLGQMYTMIYVNGAEVLRGSMHIVSSVASTSSVVSGDILLAATNTVELYHFQDSGGDEATNTSNGVYLSGHLVHAT